VNTLFSSDFKKSVKKHSSIKKSIKKKIDMIISNPITLGEPLKGNFRGFYSCPVKKSYLIIYLVPERKWPFSPISALNKNFNPRNTLCMPVVKIVICLELDEKSRFRSGTIYIVMFAVRKKMMK